MHLHHAIRALKRSPIYAVTVVMTLALGLSALGSMLAIARSVLLAPLPYGDSERLVRLELRLNEGGDMGHSPAIQALYRSQSRQVAEIAIYRTGRANVMSDGPDKTTDNIAAAWFSASTLKVLQVSPLIGRGFTASEELRSGPDAVILSEQEWRSRFQASPDVLGKTILVNDVVRQIVGVMPATFEFPDARARLWLPVKSANDELASDFFYGSIARLAPAATPASAELELATILPRLGEFYPRLGSGGVTSEWLSQTKPMPRVTPLRAALTHDVAPTLWLLTAMAALVLMVAWVNVANLAWVRADAGRRDATVRAALGAGRFKAMQQAIAESLLLGVAAALLSVLSIFAVLALLKVYGPPGFPRLSELSVSASGVVLVTVIALFSAGVLPLWTSLSKGTDALGLPRFALLETALAPGLNEGAYGQTANTRQQRLRGGASVLQIALALVVLSGALVLARTAYRLNQVELGFNPAQVSTFRILLPFARYDEIKRVAFYAQLSERVRALPSVHAAGLVSQLPLSGVSLPEQPFRLDRQTHTHSHMQTMPVNVISDGYLSALGIPLLAGRDFYAIPNQSPDQILINQRAAALLHSEGNEQNALGRQLSLEPQIAQSALGRQLSLEPQVAQSALGRQLSLEPQVAQSALGRQLSLEPGGPRYTVVGVVGDVHQEDLAEPARAMVYRSQTVAARVNVDPGALPSMVLVVRTAGNSEPLPAAVRNIVRELDPGVPVFEIQSMDDVVRLSTSHLRLVLMLTSAAAVAVLALGMLGLYGVMAYSVSLQRRAFGLRIALGADASHIARSVVSRGLVLTAIGAVIGLVIFAALGSTLRAAVPNVQVLDPLALFTALLLLAMTAALASWLPARQAASIDPQKVLR
jgi:predicted permease